MKCVSPFELYGSGCNADGIFEGNDHLLDYSGGERMCTWGEQRVKFEIQKT
jgi:hypothetical protein